MPIFRIIPCMFLEFIADYLKEFKPPKPDAIYNLNYPCYRYFSDFKAQN